MGKLFGTDGVRGSVGVWPITPDFFLGLGAALGMVLLTEWQAPSIVVGRDPRRSGQMLNQAFFAGLLSVGVDVLDLGIFPTAGVAYITKKIGASAGAVVSASHNPVDQNGIKFFDSRGMKIPEKFEQEIEELLLDRQEIASRPPGQLGQVKNVDDLREIYIQGLLDEHPNKFLSGLTILVDCSNGAAFQIGPEVFARAGAEAIVLHGSPDGLNINHQCGSEYARREPEMVGQLLKNFGADFCLAFDGDADRVVFIDETGGLVDGDHMLGFLAKYLQKKHLLLADTIVTSQMRNTGLKRFIEASGLRMVETPVGDKYIVEKLVEMRQHAPDSALIGLGGEQAGHIDLIDRDNTTGDGIRTALFVMRAFQESGLASLSEFAAGVGKTPQIIASAYVGQGSRLSQQALQDLEEKHLALTQSLIRINLRYSGTEPLLRAMLESDARLTETDLATIATLICRSAQSYAGVDHGEIDILNCTRGGTIQVSD